MTARFEILDTTLREGEQCYGVFFSRDVKKRIAILLDQIGVDFIEVGHPAAAPSIRQAVSEIAELRLRPNLVAHARLDKDEIRVVRDAGVQWVGLFCGISAGSLRRYGLSRQALYERAVRAVAHAKELGLRIKFTCEDASRTPVQDLISFYGHLRSLGVDRLSYADTVGLDTPEKIDQLHAELKRFLPFEQLHFHFHNDRGRAYDNAVKAIELGAECIDASIMGIGERMGLAPLEELLNRMDDVGAGRLDGGQNGRRHAAVEAARKLVTESINRDHFGQRRFAHKSGIHLNGMMKDPASYEPGEPQDCGGQRLFVLSKLIGRSGLRMLLSRYGFSTDSGTVDKLLKRIKAEELLELAEPSEIADYLSGKWPERQTA